MLFSHLFLCFKRDRDRIEFPVTNFISSFSLFFTAVGWMTVEYYDFIWPDEGEVDAEGFFSRSPCLSLNEKNVLLHPGFFFFCRILFILRRRRWSQQLLSNRNLEKMTEKKRENWTVSLQRGKVSCSGPCLLSPWLPESVLWGYPCTRTCSILFV